MRAVAKPQPKETDQAPAMTGVFIPRKGKEMALPNTMPNTLRSLADQIDDLEYSRDQHREIAERLKAERDELRHRLKLSQDELGQLRLEHQDGTPRIITADELEVGMWAAWHHNGKWWVEVIEGGYSYSCIDGPFVLLADAPPKEPDRRGRVVKRGELRDGDVIDFWASRGGALEDIYVSRGSEWADNAPWPGEEIRLVSRKPPEPSEHEAIRAFRFYQAVPIEGGSPLLWEPIGEEYVGRYGPVPPENILDWSPARVVPAGREG